MSVGGDGDYNNVGNGSTDNPTDGENNIVVFAYVRNDFAVAISQLCGERDHEQPGTHCI